VSFPFPGSPHLTCAAAPEKLRAVNTNSLGRVFSAGFLSLALVGVALAGTTLHTTELGDNTYQIVCKATSAFTRDVEAMKAEAQAAAEQYCTVHGKQIKVISLTAQKPFFSTGYASATITFKAYNAGDPALTAPVAAPGTVAAPAAPPPPPPMTTTDLYNDLLKLDDLRKRGILTEEEFQAEKKKLLSHSQ